MADSLMSVLARIPGYGGALAKRQYNQQEEANEVRQASTLMQIIGQQQERQAKQAALQKQGEFHTALKGLGPNATHDDMIRLAVNSGLVPPKDLATIMQGAENKKLQVDATRAANLARLAETARLNDSTMSHRISQETNAEARLNLERQQAQMRNYFNQQSLNLQGERLFYDTGVRVPTPAAPTAPRMPNSASNVEMFAEVPESDKAAYQLARSGVSASPDRQVTPQELARMADVPGTPTAAPQPAPAAPQPVAAAPNNFDARDLRLQNMQSGATPAAVATAAPTMPKFTGSPREQAAARNKWLLDQHRPSIAGAGLFTPEALRMTAEQYLAGDRQAIQGYARNAPARIALQNEIQKVAKEKGWSGVDVAAQMADFAGIMSGSRTVGTRAAQIELASSEAEKMIDIVLNRSKSFERTNFIPFNVALKSFDTNTGQPEVKAFGAAINSLVNVYARAISPSGVPTVSDKEHAREMLASIDSPAQVNAVMDVMKEEMKAARAAPGEVRAATRRAVTGAASPTEKPSPTFDADKERRYQEWKKRQK